MPYDDRYAADILDIYSPPPTTAPRPAVLFVHGGGWHDGIYRDSIAPVAERFAGAGYVTVNIDYRLVPSQGGQYPHAVQDCYARRGRRRDPVLRASRRRPHLQPRRRRRVVGAAADRDRDARCRRRDRRLSRPHDRAGAAMSVYAQAVDVALPSLDTGRGIDASYEHALDLELPGFSLRATGELRESATDDYTGWMF